MAGPKSIDFSVFLEEEEEPVEPAIGAPAPAPPVPPHPEDDLSDIPSLAMLADKREQETERNKIAVLRETTSTAPAKETLQQLAFAAESGVPVDKAGSDYWAKWAHHGRNTKNFDLRIENGSYSRRVGSGGFTEVVDAESGEVYDQTSEDPEYLARWGVKLGGWADTELTDERLKAASGKAREQAMLLALKREAEEGFLEKDQNARWEEGVGQMGFYEGLLARPSPQELTAESRGMELSLIRMADIIDAARASGWEEGQGISMNDIVAKAVSEKAQFLPQEIAHRSNNWRDEDKKKRVELGFFGKLFSGDYGPYALAGNFGRGMIQTLGLVPLGVMFAHKAGELPESLIPDPARPDPKVRIPSQRELIDMRRGYSDSEMEAIRNMTMIGKPDKLMRGVHVMGQGIAMLIGDIGDWVHHGGESGDRLGELGSYMFDEPLDATGFLAVTGGAARSVTAKAIAKGTKTAAKLYDDALKMRAGNMSLTEGGPLPGWSNDLDLQAKAVARADDMVSQAKAMDGRVHVLTVANKTAAAIQRYADPIEVMIRTVGAILPAKSKRFFTNREDLLKIDVVINGESTNLLDALGERGQRLRERLTNVIKKGESVPDDLIAEIEAALRDLPGYDTGDLWIDTPDGVTHNLVPDRVGPDPDGLFDKTLTPQERAVIQKTPQKAIDRIRSRAREAARNLNKPEWTELVEKEAVTLRALVANARLGKGEAAHLIHLIDELDPLRLAEAHYTEATAWRSDKFKEVANDMGEWTTLNDRRAELLEKVRDIRTRREPGTPEALSAPQLGVVDTLIREAQATDPKWSLRRSPRLLENRIDEFKYALDETRSLMDEVGAGEAGPILSEVWDISEQMLEVEKRLQTSVKEQLDGYLLFADADNLKKRGITRAEVVANNADHIESLLDSIPMSPKEHRMIMGLMEKFRSARMLYARLVPTKKGPKARGKPPKPAREAAAESDRLAEKISAKLGGKVETLAEAKGRLLALGDELSTAVNAVRDRFDNLNNARATARQAAHARKIAEETMKTGGQASRTGIAAMLTSGMVPRAVPAKHIAAARANRLLGELDPGDIDLAATRKNLSDEFDLSDLPEAESDYFDWINANFDATNLEDAVAVYRVRSPLVIDDMDVVQLSTAARVASDLRTDAVQAGAAAVREGLLDESVFLLNIHDYFPDMYKRYEAAFRSFAGDDAANRVASVIKKGGSVRIGGQHFRKAMYKHLDIEERTAMGLIRDPRYVYIAGYNRIWSDIEAARLFRTLKGATFGEGHALAGRSMVIEPQTTATGKIIVTDPKRPPMNVQKDWKQLPVTNDRVAGEGKRGFGKLNGHYVPPELYDELMRYHKVTSNAAARIHGRWLRFWKWGHTAGAPATQSRNFVSNIPVADMIGMNPLNPMNRAARKAQKETWSEAWDHTGAYEEAFIDGVFGKTYIDAEVDQALSRIVGMPKEPSMGAMGDFIDFGFAATDELVRGSVPQKILGYGKRAKEFASRNYRFGDEYFKLWRYKQIRILQKEFRRTGKITGEMQRAFGGWEQARNVVDVVDDKTARRIAVEDVNLRFPDYTNVSKFVQLARSYYMPFISFSWKAIPIMGRMAREHPIKAAMYRQLYQQLETAMYFLDGTPTEEEIYAIEAARESIPSYGRAGAVYTGKDTITRADGTEVDTHTFGDIQWWTYAGGMTRPTEDYDVDIVPDILEPNWPVLPAAGAVLFNRNLNSPRSGDIATKGGGRTAMETVTGTLRAVKNAMLPSHYGGRTWDKVVDASLGLPYSPRGHVQTWDEIVKETVVGVKVRHQQRGWGLPQKFDANVRAAQRPSNKKDRAMMLNDPPKWQRTVRDRVARVVRAHGFSAQRFKDSADKRIRLMHRLREAEGPAKPREAESPISVWRKNWKE